MQRDPFYRQIIAGLETRLDRNLFEDCAVALLSLEIPGLVPVSGGSDSGMDGMIADGEGEPIPLVTTTGKDAIGNLTKNLNKYVADGGRRREAVFATSKHLTPQKEHNLFSRARELKFVLRQIYDQEAFAIRLYRNPQWCLELLGLTGTPPALSALPKMVRPLLTIPLIGREADFDWLNNIKGDSLLVGQPGSGKTFLFYNLAKTGEALFAVSSDIGQIAQSYRESQPNLIIVDDAHLPHNQELILNLKHHREESGASFEIIASCWPGQQPLITELLGLPSSRVHTLERLKRDEILQIVQAAWGFNNNALFSYPWNRIIKELIDQAEGRPGLAVTLTQLFLQGDWQRIVSGDVLAQSAVDVFLPTSDRHVKQVLAGFAVGGDAGMPLEVVADTLSISLAIVQNTVGDLAAGGIVTDLRDTISVRPTALRFALIREVFCSGTAMDLPERILDSLINQAPYLPDVVRTLIGSAGRGAIVPAGLLVMLLEKIDLQGSVLRSTLPGYSIPDQHSDLWQMYAWLGPNETQWILETYPEKLTEIVWPALEYVSEIAFPMLFQASIGDNRALNAHLDHPMRRIQDWVSSAEPGTSEVLVRRRALLSAVKNWILSGKDISIGLQGLHYAFSPQYQFATSDPGSGDELVIRHGILLLDEVKALSSEWPRARKLLENAEWPDWQPLRELVEEWVYNGWVTVEIPDETRVEMERFAVELLSDIVGIAANRLGILHWARELATNTWIDIQVPIDPEFDALFPVRRRGGDWEIAGQNETVVARKLARQWAKLGPAAIIPKIVSIVREAELSGRTWPEYSSMVCGEIAKSIDNAIEWLAMMVDSPLGPGLLQPFLTKAIHNNESGWLELAYQMLEMPFRKSIVISELLKMSNLPEDVLGHVLSHTTELAHIVEILCIRNEIPEPTLLLLYQHTDPHIAGKTAVASWHAEPIGIIPEGLHTAWRAAVLNWNSDDYHLAAILKNDSRLAEEWLSARLAEENFLTSRHGKIRELVAQLGQDSRLRLLEQIPDRYGLDELVVVLVDRQPGIYQVLLGMAHLRRYHLVPLAGIPDETWVELAKLALITGHKKNRISEATFGSHWSWSGNESEMWAEWIDHWEALHSHPNLDIRAVAQEGIARAKARYNQAREREKTEAIYGRM